MDNVMFQDQLGDSLRRQFDVKHNVPIVKNKSSFDDILLH